MVALVVKW
uniref:Uncharacterized protein n=1 Tax=Arundo donax TaxID=35708 RepID=A0A0A9CQY4_ARUDO